MFARSRHGRRCVAAIEFAITCPILLVIVAGLADFPLSFWDHSLIETGVASGAAYTFAQMQADLGQNKVVSASNIKAVVQDAITLPNVSVAVTGPRLACVLVDTTSSPPAVTLAAAQVGSTCPNGSLPGTYVSITATYNYVPLMPFYGAMTSTTITETANVRAY